MLVDLAFLIVDSALMENYVVGFGYKGGLHGLSIMHLYLMFMYLSFFRGELKWLAESALRPAWESGSSDPSVDPAV